MGYIPTVSSRPHGAPAGAQRWPIVAGIAFGCFVAGVAATELVHRRGMWPDQAVGARPATAASTSRTGAGSPPGPEPRIVFDAASIDLLPDASLTLELPRGFDAGTR